AKGNKGWTSIYAEHPELPTMSDVQASRFVRGKALDEIRHHPATFARGLARSGGDYLQFARDEIMGPIEQAPLQRLLYVGAGVGAAAAILWRWRTSRWRVLVDLALFGGVVLALPLLFGNWGVGVWASGSHYQDWLPLALVAGGYLAYVVCGTERVRSPCWSFAAVSLVGIAISLPFVPFYDAGARAYAASLPFFALALAGAAAILVRVIRGVRVALPSMRRRSHERSWWPVAVGGGIVATIVLGTPIAMATVSKPETHPRLCPDGHRAEAYLGGVGMHLVGNE